MDYTYIDKYKEDTGYDVGNHCIDNTMYYSEDYVEWLQEQLKLCGVVSTSCDLSKEQLKRKIQMADMEHQIKRERT